MAPLTNFRRILKPNSTAVLLALIVSGASRARAAAALFLEEPFGMFGHMNPTAHAAAYLSKVCAACDQEIYSFEIETTGAQDARLIKKLNSETNRSHFNFLFRNCADFPAGY